MRSLALNCEFRALTVCMESLYVKRVKYQQYNAMIISQKMFFLPYLWIFQDSFTENPSLINVKEGLSFLTRL